MPYDINIILLLIDKGGTTLNHKYVFLLAFAHFSTDISSGALPALLPFFISQYGMDYTAVTGLMFAFCFLSSIIQPLFGWLADKKSHSWYMPAGVLLSGTAMGLSGLSSKYWILFTIITISGIGSAIFHPEAARMVNKISGTKRGTALSIFSVGGNSGFAAGPMIVIAGITLLGMNGIALLCLISLITAIILLLRIPKMKREIRQTTRTQNADTVKKSTGKNDWNAFLRLTCLITCSSIVICGLRSFIPLYWVHMLGLSENAAGTALTLLFALGVVTTFIGGILADKFGYLAIVRSSYILLALMTALLSQTTTPAIAYLLMIPIGFAMFSPFSSVVVLGQNYLARSIGFASGITMGLSFSIGGVLVPLIGRCADAYGLPATMELLTLVAAGAAISSLLLPKR